MAHRNELTVEEKKLPLREQGILKADRMIQDELSDKVHEPHYLDLYGGTGRLADQCKWCGRMPRLTRPGIHFDRTPAGRVALDEAYEKFAAENLARGGWSHEHDFEPRVDGFAECAKCGLKEGEGPHPTRKDRHEFRACEEYPEVCAVCGFIADYYLHEEVREKGPEAKTGGRPKKAQPPAPVVTGAAPPSTPTSGTMLHVRIDDDLRIRLDKFRFGNWFETRTEAVKWLIDWALEQKPEVKR